jgi:hypothetical protein
MTTKLQKVMMRATPAVGQPAADGPHQRGEQRTDEGEFESVHPRKLGVDQHRKADGQPMNEPKVPV